jgi:S-adenosylmethionine:tRNA ribosyltransferase-isomerase
LLIGNGMDARITSGHDEAVRTDLFDYHLPEELIALRPAVPRDAARLLVVAPAAEPLLADRMIRDLPDLLQPGDALVFNDTKVIPAELSGVRVRNGARAQISVTLIERLGPDRWQALARPAKRLKPGDRIAFGEGGNACLLGALSATVEARGEDGEVTLSFDLSCPALDEAIHTLGAMPLPPYIASRRTADARDMNDYQTLFSRAEGAVAAPTAGLHFTERLMQALVARGISRHFVTLHVGPGTFLPVRSANTEDHRMHAERGHVSAETAEALNRVRARGGNVVAVGTTSLRLLESVAGEDGQISPFDGQTSLFITPGYRFRVVDRLLTNFHLPRSTLFMLVASFSGLEVMKRAYAHAVGQRYRFYSYGDACLLSPAQDSLSPTGRGSG